MAVFAAIVLGFVSYVRQYPQDMPWTELDLARPVGAFTGRKLTALDGDFARCKRLLTRAGVKYEERPARGSDQCRAADSVRLESGGATSIAYSPASVAPSCPVAASLALWEWNVVQPAAREHLGSPVTAIVHLGSYGCRRMYGRSGGAWSEHATADAIDIAGFRLEDGRTISVLRDWNGGPREAAFLRAVRDGACDLFATTLSPEYNAAHADHFHLDQAERGKMGWRACR